MTRNIVVAGLGAGAFALIGAPPARAYGVRHAFCIQGGEEYPALSGCTFDTYEQCRASASRRNLSCIANPYFVGQSDDPYAFQNRNPPFPPNYIQVPPNIYSRRIRCTDARERELTVRNAAAAMSANRRQRRTSMRYPALAAIAFATMFTALPASAQTYGRGYPVCLHQYGPATYYDCSYGSIAQCNASASGRSAQCVVNPFMANAGMDEWPQVRHGRYRAY